jgi:hypothetical protein
VRRRHTPRRTRQGRTPEASCAGAEHTWSER